MRRRLAPWAGPLTIGSFAAVALTGILLFFHAGTGLAKPVHELTGWIMIAAVVAHTVVNWRPFVAYFRKPLGATAICLLLAVGIASPFLATGAHNHSQGQRAFIAVSRALEKSPLHVVAQVAKTTPESIVKKLATQGIQVRDHNQTIAEIASANNKRSMEILSHILVEVDVPTKVATRG